ncbi:unnamed protein product [Tilletia caries]|nr:unnamed protein product [Tilletia caries]
METTSSTPGPHVPQTLTMLHPSACFVSTATGPRLAHFQAVIRLPYIDEHLQERFKQYVVASLLDTVSWPNGYAFSSTVWRDLGHLAAVYGSGTRTIVDIDSVLGPAIVFPGSHMLDSWNGVVATLAQSVYKPVYR